MSFVTTRPAARAAAAGNLQAIGTAMAAQNAAAAAPTTGVAPAAADPVSALQATQFAAYGSLYQQISAQATAIHEMFVHTLQTSADSYDATEAANSAAAAPSAGGLGATALAGAGTGTAATDPSFGLGGLLSNSGILAAMQGANIGSATSEFTGLGKGYISEPSGVISGSVAPMQAGLVNQTAPAGIAAPAGFATPAATPVSAGVGQASSVGGLSVPPNWAGETAPVSGTARATLAGAGWTAAAPHNPPVTTVPAGLPALASAERGGFGFGTPRYGVKPTVMPRPAVV